MKEKKEFNTKEALKLIGISRRKLAVLENTNKIFKIPRKINPISKNKDRVFTQDTIDLVKWVLKQIKNGLSSDAVRLLVEYYQQGKIESVKWYK